MIVHQNSSHVVSHYMPEVTVDEVLWAAFDISGDDPTRGAASIKLRRFKALFGITPHMCALIWNIMDDNQCHPSGGDYSTCCGQLCF